MRRGVALLMAFALMGSACTRTSEPEPTNTSNTASTTTETAPDESTATITEGPDGPIDAALLVELPTDPDVRIATLANGLTYYIRFNDSPGLRVELRLVVDAGSVLEDDEQSGGAHFLEHMMFNGTEKYPKNELISVLESFGPQFGPDINAYTSFDETVYELSVPTDNPEILVAAMDVLVQWARHANLTQADVEDERGVVVEEWRVRDQGLAGRVSAAFGDLILTGTAYEGHLPIGAVDSISSMDSDPLRRFYEEWYRPDLMAIVVVGDIDVDEVETMIVESFGGFESPDTPTPRPKTTVDAPGSPEAAVLADPEATSPSVDLFYMVGSDAQFTTVGDMQRLTALAMAMNMMEIRLSEDALKGVVPFFDAASYDFEYSREIKALGLSVSSEAVALEASAEVLLAEVARAKQFGFTDAEFDRTLELFEAINEQLRDGQDSRQDSQFAADYVEHFLSGAAIPSIDQFADLQDQMFDRLTRQDIEEAFANLIVGSAPRLFVVGPDEPASAVPSADRLLALVGEVATSTLQPRPDDLPVPDELMARPEEVEPTSVALNEAIGYLELDYANGARVLFWPTTIADNLVSFSASSFGGLSQVDIPDLTEAEFGVEIIARSGLGGHDQVTVDRVLSDQLVGLFPFITNTHEGFNGSAATEDIETLFQLLNLSIASPRIEDVATSIVLTEARPRVEFPERTPRLLATISLLRSYYGPDDDRHWTVPPLDEFNRFDSVRALEVYRERFGNPGEFLFVFVGDADVDAMLSLSNAYIGSLVGTPSDEGFIDYQPLPTGEQITTVEAGQDDQGLVQFQFTNALEGQDVESDVVADLLELIANNRLRDRIREALSATYSPSLNIDVQLEPDPYIETHVAVSGDPERLDEIAEEVLADVADLRSNGPTAEQLAIAQEQLFREYELFNNPFLIERAIFFEEHDGREISELFERFDIIDTVSIADIRALARIAFPIGSYIEVKLIPAS